MEATPHGLSGRRPGAPADRDRATGLDREVARRTVRTGALLAAACGVFALPYAAGGPIEFVVANVMASVALLLVALVPIRNAELWTGSPPRGRSAAWRPWPAGLPRWLWR